MTTDTALLIFDPHQDTAWIRRILKKENGNFTHLLLGGDYFDAKSDRAGSLSEMADLLLELQEAFGSNMTLIWGNHDIQYLEAIPTMRQHKNPRNQNYKIPGDYSNSKAKKLSKLLPKRFLEKGRLFATLNGYLISHAGIAGCHWPEAESDDDSLRLLDSNSKEALFKLPYKAHPLLLAGTSRGGTQATGGLTWLDFDEEFLDELNIPQLFGHTPSFSENLSARARQCGKSWCLDGAQTIYGKLSSCGELTIENA